MSATNPNESTSSSLFSSEANGQIQQYVQDIPFSGQYLPPSRIISDTTDRNDSLETDRMDSRSSRSLQSLA